MKAILISIKPRFVTKILNGEKTIEVRKTCPKQLRGDTPVVPEPIDVYIYCTKSDYLGYISKRYIGKVVAKFTLNKVEEIEFDDDRYETNSLIEKEILLKSCLNYQELNNYLKYKVGYAWHISNLKVLENPLPLQPYFDLDRPPQSWQFIESED